MRLQTARGITEGEEGLMMAAWLRTLRNVAFTMATLQRPEAPIPPGPLESGDIAGRDQIAASPTCRSMAPSFANSDDLAAAAALDADLERGLPDLQQVEPEDPDPTESQDDFLESRALLGPGRATCTAAQILASRELWILKRAVGG